MGADIHIYAEKKLKNGDWSLFSTFPSVSCKSFGIEQPESRHTSIIWPLVGSRDYNFFGALANVRREGPDPRGLPDDLSPYVAQEWEHWRSDGHSASWYSAEEFLPLYLEHKHPEECVQLVGGHTTKEQLLDTYFGISTWDQDIADYRFVFWFDN